LNLSANVFRAVKGIHLPYAYSENGKVTQ